MGERFCKDPVWRALQDQPRQDADPKPAFNHGHNRIVVPCREAYLRRQVEAGKNFRDFRFRPFFKKHKRKIAESYLFVTAGDKPFSSKEFSHALGISRVSFAPKELMEEMLGTKIGAATVFSAMLDPERDAQIVFDKDVAEEAFYGCSDGTTTGYMKVRTEDIIGKFLPYAGHTPHIIEIGR